MFPERSHEKTLFFLKSAGLCSFLCFHNFLGIVTPNAAAEFFRGGIFRGLLFESPSGQPAR